MYIFTSDVQTDVHMHMCRFLYRKLQLWRNPRLRHMQNQSYIFIWASKYYRTNITIRTHRRAF